MSSGLVKWKSSAISASIAALLADVSEIAGAGDFDGAVSHLGSLLYRDAFSGL